MSPANYHRELRSSVEVNPENPIFQRQVDPEPKDASMEQAANVQTGVAPSPTTQSPMLNEETQGAKPVPPARPSVAAAVRDATEQLRKRSV